MLSPVICKRPTDKEHTLYFSQARHLTSKLAIAAPCVCLLYKGQELGGKPLDHVLNITASYTCVSQIDPKFLELGRSATELTVLYKFTLDVSSRTKCLFPIV